MKYIMLMILALTVTTTLSACNTVHGAGETLEKASDRSK